MTSFSSRRPLRCAVSTSSRSAGSASALAAQQLLERAQHQGQRRAELVADVGEEGGLGAVQLGQRVGPPPLLVVGMDVGEAGRDLSGHQLDEPAVGGIERPERVERRRPGSPAGRFQALLGDRAQQRLARRLVPVARRQRTPAATGRPPGPARRSASARPRARARSRRSSRIESRRGGWPGGDAGARRSGAPTGRPRRTGRAAVNGRSRPFAAEAALDRRRQTSARSGRWPARSRARRSVASRRSPITRSVSSVTTQSMPAIAPAVVAAAGCRRRCGRSPRDSRCARGTAAGLRPRSRRRCVSTVSMRGPISCQISAQTSSEREPSAQSALDAQGRPVGVVAEEGESRPPAPSTSRSARSA